MAIIKYSVAFAVGCIMYYSFCTRDQNAKPKVTHSFTAQGWEEVSETFRKQVESGWQHGGALSVYHKGELVVDIYGGYADEYILLEWSKDTISQFYSTTKALGAIVMAMLVDRGLLDYTKPVSHYWPEFAQNGKEDITVELLLGHQAGLVALDEPFDMLDIINDDTKMSSILAAQKPLWEPGTGVGYHSLTIGLYEDQLVKRIDHKGRSLSQFFKEEVAQPYNLDIFIGLPKQENYRCARIVKGKPDTLTDYFKTAALPLAVMFSLSDEESLIFKMLSNPKNILELNKYFNHPSWRAVPCASFSGYGTATSLAKLFGTLASKQKENKNIKPLLNEKIIKLLSEPLENGNGTDKVFGVPVVFGRGVSIWKSTLGSNVFGAPGAGGQVGKCDPSNELGIGYITSHSSVDDDVDEKYFQLERSIYETLKKIK